LHEDTRKKMEAHVNRHTAKINKNKTPHLWGRRPCMDTFEQGSVPTWPKFKAQTTWRWPLQGPQAHQRQRIRHQHSNFQVPNE
jgi:hypothetical protein